MEEITQLLEDCERLIRIEDANIILDRVPLKYLPLEEWYQNERLKYSPMYLKLWTFNVGPCLFDYLCNCYIRIFILVFILDYKLNKFK